jgi:hypothetical protein
MWFEASLGKKAHTISKNPSQIIGLVEWLKAKALSSNPRNAK